MLTLYLLQTVLLLIAFTIMTVPVMRYVNLGQGPRPSISLITVALLFSFFVIAFYVGSERTKPLKTWLVQGKAHYDLMVTYQSLGGIDGIILKVRQKLMANPSDDQGWQILHKLYSIKQDPAHAAAALQHQLD